MATRAAGQWTEQRLAATMGGRLITPEDHDYDQARAIWNGMHDLRPALIARCESPSDVVRAVDFARERSLPVAVRGGGHGVAGKATCEGGLVIDLSPMRGVQVDPARKVARAEGGATGSDLDRATQTHGLAVTLGTDSRTGIAGLTLGGGMGFLARRCGLAADNLLAADIVLADGSQVRANAQENPDLFWALRGGGGNFGVVTAFEYRLHEVGPQLQVVQAFHPYEHAHEALRFYREFHASLPGDAACYCLVANVPPVEPFPESRWGEPAVVFVACHPGPLDEGAEILLPLAEYGEPIFVSAAATEYTALQSGFDAASPDGERYYWKSQYLSGLPDEAIDVFVDHARSLPPSLSSVYFEPMGGAVNAVPRDATAFPHRDAAFNLGFSTGWSDFADDERMIAWTKAFHRAMTPFSTGGVYVNYLDHDDAARVRAAYGENYDRLRRVKASYDPDNFFNSNQNIGPK
ncbi:MAG TPA: FAD-binding oxidoreductase [Trueperaceae bacterium]|nr:FAD-binding oxidoreductase [Trueperaceae bacterium]